MFYVIWKQRGAGVNEAPKLQHVTLSFLATFFSHHPPDQQPPYRFRRLFLLQFFF